jgi:hypothetical protein
MGDREKQCFDEECSFADPLPRTMMETSLLENRDYTVIFAKRLLEPTLTPPGFTSRWTAAEASVLNLVNQCEHFDPDGITVYLARQVELGQDSQKCDFQKYDRVTSTTLEQIIRDNLPPAQINLKQVLETALNDYFNRKAAGKTKANGEILLVLLDGEPGDRMAVAKVIREATQRIDSDEELGIGFVQIGQDLIAKGFLTALDDNLQSVGARFDIVTTMMLDEILPDALTEFLLSTLTD